MVRLSARINVVKPVGAVGARNEEGMDAGELYILQVDQFGRIRGAFATHGHTRHHPLQPCPHCQPPHSGAPNEARHIDLSKASRYNLHSNGCMGQVRTAREHTNTAADESCSLFIRYSAYSTHSYSTKLQQEAWRAE